MNHDNEYKKQGITQGRYYWLHTLLKRYHGKANKCEHCKIPNKKLYQWALIKGRKYSSNPEDYIQLCRSCHAKYDYTDEQRKKNSELKKGREAKGKIVHQMLNGKTIKTYKSVKFASRELNCLSSSIFNALHGWSKTSGGFEWKYKK